MYVCVYTHIRTSRYILSLIARARSLSLSISLSLARSLARSLAQVDPRRVLDHPCRFVDASLQEKADALMLARQAAGGEGGGGGRERERERERGYHDCLQ